MAFDKRKGEEGMTSEEDALQILAKKRNKEGECPNIKSTKRRKTKPAKPAKIGACKRERTTTETVPMEMRNSKRMRRTEEVTGLTGECLGREPEMTEKGAISELNRDEQGAGLSTKVSEPEFISKKSEKKPTKLKNRTIVQFFAKEGTENSNLSTKKNSQFKLKVEFGKSSRKSTYRSKPSLTQHQAVKTGLAAPIKDNLLRSAKSKPITAYFSPLNKQDNEKSCEVLGINR